MSSTDTISTEVSTFVASSATAWRDWLERNGQSEKEIWLIIHHKDSATPSLRYHEAIEHALCYGWIDGLHRRRDADSSQLRFTPRTPRSTWSRVNRERAANMIERGLMTAHGQALIDLAKAKGTWQVVPDDHAAALPDDLREPLHRNEAAAANFEKFPPSSRRLILEWIATAKKPETRQRRIDRTVALAEVNVRANHPGVRVGGAGAARTIPQAAAL
ncbi:YdeI family protein [Rhodococcus sp. NPDC058514]|uniref:YdeI/OmpD-associated family protein n=1 Tax=unclassified Rhodococcus (in: high G+C Gram-positive bacteria) TaxID=192944 RepID=UPI00365EA701